jgi:protein phosphatase
MTHSEPRIQCSNPHCTASNQLEAHFCHRCKTPLNKRYLWSLNQIIADEQTQQLIGDRYLSVTTRIFLDTKPGIKPQTADEVPKELITYLQLFPHYPHIPQVYGQVDGTNTWLLDYGTVPLNSEGQLQYKQLLPELANLWRTATAFQQLSWLRQIAKLWRPMLHKQVASTLLSPELLRINGQVVQVMQFKPDIAHTPKLQDLGQLWTQWAEYAHPSIRQVLIQLCERVKIGSLSRSRQIMAILDRAMELYGRSQQYSYQIYAISDSGPSRNNNEDAAYPNFDAPINVRGDDNPLAIVCDGVGGHEGGEIASQNTIDYLRSNIAKLSFAELQNNPQLIAKKLTQLINESNDSISQRNDSEQRMERQRMGTTLVMGVAHNHEIYLAHVGDSRIYWITPNSCHQVTVDDDLASREVRLGYAVYRDSLEYPSAGALIQALGMRDSAALHPNIQRHLIDDDCIFLLCTDGLSDFDRIEQHWRHIILPVLQAKRDLANAVKTLIKIANEKNGHDNATVALIHCQVKQPTDGTAANLTWSDVELETKELNSWSDTDPTATNLPKAEAVDTNLPPEPTAVPPTSRNFSTSPKKSSGWLISLVLLLLISLIVGGIFYVFLLKETEKKPPRRDLPESEILNES